MPAKTKTHAIDKAKQMAKDKRGDVVFDALAAHLRNAPDTDARSEIVGVMEYLFPNSEYRLRVKWSKEIAARRLADQVMQLALA